MPLPSLLLKNTIDTSIMSKDKGDFYKKLNENNTSLNIILKIINQKINSSIKKISNKIFVLQGLTGSGKSTTFISGLVNTAMKYGTLLCTQPRIALAEEKYINLAIDEKKYNPGSLITENNVSVKTSKISRDFKDPQSNIKLLFCTTQILSNLMEKMEDNKFGKIYPIVVIDECHEISLEMNYVFKNIREYIKNNYNKPFCPLFIFMSATLDINLFKSYFDINIGNPELFIKVLGSTNYPIGIKHLNDQIVCDNKIAEKNMKKAYKYKKIDISNNLIDTETNILLNIIENCKRNDEYLGGIQNDIIVMNPATSQGIKIIKKMQNIDNIKKLISDKKLDIFPYSSIDIAKNNINHKKFIEDKNSDIRRIVLSTTLLQAGATMKYLRFIIDSGWTNYPIVNPYTEKELFSRLPISKSDVEQRIGRVGRLFPGIFISMYSKNVFNNLSSIKYPITCVSPIIYLKLLNLEIDIIKSQIKNFHIYNDLYYILLMMVKAKKIKINIFRHTDTPYPIPIDMCTYVSRKLIKNGLIYSDYTLTIIGLYSGLLGFSANQTKLVLSLMKNNYNVIDIAIIVAIYFNLLEKDKKIDSLPVSMFIKIPTPKNKGNIEYTLEIFHKLCIYRSNLIDESLTGIDKSGFSFDENQINFSQFEKILDSIPFIMEKITSSELPCNYHSTPIIGHTSDYSQFNSIKF